MLEIFNKTDGVYTLPNGATMTSKEMQDSGEYQMLFNANCVVSIMDGIFTSYQPLQQLAEGFGVAYDPETSDPQTVLDQIKERQKVLKENSPVTLTDTVMKAAKFAAVLFTDEQALEVRDLYDEYQVGHAYKKDERFTYNGHLFKVNQDHTSQEQWVPGENGTESLYTSLEMSDNGYLNWQQPTGSHDAYNTGDIVNYKGELYKSLIDGNAWAPDVYPAGWEKYTEPTS